MDYASAPRERPRASDIGILVGTLLNAISLIGAVLVACKCIEEARHIGSENFGPLLAIALGLPLLGAQLLLILPVSYLWAWRGLGHGRHLCLFPLLVNGIGILIGFVGR